ncbi:MAG: YihA family ribosome biogenesis GTP-binding protein [Bacteroidales bacterium]|nr:YihA family ribosome biogenesis GTP-binding protein [Bacteroidales bacterium]
MLIKSAKFVASNASEDKCPEPALPEFAFIGRSNVGKSSLINMLAEAKGMAKISGTPGKTQTINHFIINDAWYLVDLPGYGYAKSSRKARTLWLKRTENYLLKRKNLLTTFLLIDSRHEPQANDLDRISWFGEHGLPFVIVFTKSDKVNNQVLKSNIEAYSKQLSSMWSELPLAIISSAKTKKGRAEILEYISGVADL